MKRLITVIGALLLTCSAIFFTTSCEKDTRDYQLTIVVTTYDSVRVQNALVHLYAPVSNSVVDYWYNTDEQGETHYTFENKVIVEIEAGKGSFKACSFVEVERGENVIYVDLQPYGTHNGC